MTKINRRKKGRYWNKENYWFKTMPTEIDNYCRHMEHEKNSDLQKYIVNIGTNSVELSGRTE